MKLYGVGRYDYQELEKKALSAEATTDDINRLGEWFRMFGDQFWNGEQFDIDGVHSIRPVYGPEDEWGDSEQEGWELR